VTVQVDTKFLRGYAGQIDADKDHALAKIEEYCRSHCKDVDGVEGTLYPARWPLEYLADSMLDLCDAARRGLWLTAYDLRNAADSYDRSDQDAAERLWTANRAWSTPDGYREVDVAVTGSAFTGGAEIRLAPPPDGAGTAEAIDSVYQLLGTINEWLKKFTGYDILAKVLPMVFGDWGAVRRIGGAWGELEHGFLAVSRDLREGLDILSEQWDSDVCGVSGASRAFDYHIRGRWVPAFEAVGQLCDGNQQLCETLALQYEYIVRSVLFVLNFYAQRIKKALKGVMTAVNWTKFLWNLWQLVSTLWQSLVDAVNLAVMQLQVFKEITEQATSTLVAWRNYMRGDFDALKAL
jgi:hypothetical protein